jgi:RNA polymerase sigma-70 factor (ECF subfamily)
VRLCTWLTGDPHAAEDLAQEALVEAHRAAGRLRDPGRRREWLTGVARNVCRRWAHRRKRELTFGVVPTGADTGHGHEVTEEIADGFDVELEIERDELADLLDRALARLRPPDRAVLIEHYFLDRPHAEIALRLGVSSAAVTMRLQRGKGALRDVLATDLRDEAAAYGLVPSFGPAGQVTRIWCPLCGQRRLVGEFAVVDPIRGIRRLVLSCPDCFAGSDLAFASSGGAAMFGRESVWVPPSSTLPGSSITPAA